MKSFGQYGRPPGQTGIHTTHYIIMLIDLVECSKKPLYSLDEIY
jgi:hypothetical protein